MLKLLQVIFRYNFKDDFKTVKLSSTQLGTTQPQLVTVTVNITVTVTTPLVEMNQAIIFLAVETNLLVLKFVLEPTNPPTNPDTAFKMVLPDARGQDLI